MATAIIAFLFAAVTGGSDCTLLHFTAQWCEPCKHLQPTLVQLASDGYDIRAVDADTNPELVRRFNVRNLPTLIIMSGGREVDRMVGVASYEQIKKRAARVAARSTPGFRGSGAPANQQQYATQQQGQSHSTTPAPTHRPSAAPNQNTPQPIVRGQSPGIRPSSNLAAAVVDAANQIPSLAGETLNSQPQQSVATQTSPALTPQQAMARAAQATVRIQVDEGNTTAFGTGTIVDVHGSEALVLTCGHLFRDMQPNSQLTVDLFAGTPREQKVVAQLIDFIADEADVGLISFRLPVPIEPVEILPRGQKLQMGQGLFSFGCDHGADPSRRDTRVKNINRFMGAANVEIFGAPAVGRSGGGLFDMQGRLVGVCNAACSEEDEGIYAAADVVYAQIDRLGLGHLLAQNQTASQPTQSPVQTASAAGQAETMTWPDDSQSTNPNAIAAGQTLSSNASPSTGHTAQVICILKDAAGNGRMVTIDGPSAGLLQQIEQEQFSDNQ